jgi:hypothetical protein
MGAADDEAPAAVSCGAAIVPLTTNATRNHCSLTGILSHLWYEFTISAGIASSCVSRRFQFLAVHQ